VKDAGSGWGDGKVGERSGKGLVESILEALYLVWYVIYYRFFFWHE